MYSEARKIHVIEEVLKVKNEAVLIAIENVLLSAKADNKSKSIVDFSGTITREEADEMMKAIEETCEVINEEDWK